MPFEDSSTCLNVTVLGPEEMCSKAHVRQLGHPHTWSKDDVKVWLNWCVEEYSLSHIHPSKLELNGKALCLLSRVDFMERVPGNGDVLFNCLQAIKAHYTVVEGFANQQRPGTRNRQQEVYQRRPLGSIPGIVSTGYWFLTGLHSTVRMALQDPSQGHSPRSTSTRSSTSGRYTEDLSGFSGRSSGVEEY